MVLGTHTVIGMYGFWLPNDGRGSGSVYVGATHLLPYGLATKVEDRRRSRARVPHDRIARVEARKALLYEPVVLTLEQIHSVARGFRTVVERTGCILYACSILPDHIHLVPKRHRYSIEKLTNLLKGGASAQLRKDGCILFKTSSSRTGRCLRSSGGMPGMCTSTRRRRSWTALTTQSRT